ncbi:hypothetical protein V5O48_018013 [Marasmius crinis-equi]|uniref:Nephrocystin 3-like N-terminal domain-containing protein n=1 Tax=Marasmius crinis-equi TaxID=585013 RepID=A0ABR3EME4_9AGAR
MSDSQFPQGPYGAEPNWASATPSSPRQQTSNDTTYDSSPPMVSYFPNARIGGIFNPNLSTVIGDQINNFNYTNHHWDLNTLWQAIADVGASHDSVTRYPLIGCHPETRKEILEMLQDWSREPLESPFYWLYGPAGHERCAKEGILVSSFFFSRNDPKRNNPTQLFLAVAYGLVRAIPPLQDIIGEVIQKDPAVLQSSIGTQFRELIEVPCRSFTDSWEPTWPSLVIIDGLDECQGNDVQQHILSILSPPSTSGAQCLPLRFLICSRPEPPIRECFDSSLLSPFSRRVVLDDSWEAYRDIRRYVHDRLDEIRQKPRYSRIKFPNPWPPHGVVNQLTDHSNGQFVYVSTAMGFVDSEFDDPRRRLEVVLKLAPKRDHEKPFHAVDVLYSYILSINPDRSMILNILALILYLPKGMGRVLHPTSRFPFPRHGSGMAWRSIENIEALLYLPEGQVDLALRAMHSVLGIADSEVRILHASFSDFLQDSSRSGDFFIEPTHYKSFTASRLIQYLVSFDFLYLEPESFASAVWHNWTGFCREVTTPTQELITALQNLKADSLYAALVYGGIEKPGWPGWHKEWQDIISNISTTVGWLERVASEQRELISRLRASTEGFHLSFEGSSRLDAALGLMYARSTEPSSYRLPGQTGITVKRGNFEYQVLSKDGPLEHLIEHIRSQIEHQPIYSSTSSCYRECTALLHAPSLTPTECFPGLFYVRVWHPSTTFISYLVDLVARDHDLCSIAVDALFSQEPNHSPLIGHATVTLPVLLSLFARVLPKIMGHARKPHKEIIFRNFLLWLKV